MKPATTDIEIMSKKELAQSIIDHEWNNTTIEGRAAKIMINLGDIPEFLNKEKERMGYQFEKYYGDDIIKMVGLLYKNEAHPHALLHNAIINDKKFSNFSWNNFSAMALYKYPELLPVSILMSYSNKRWGEIKNIHDLNKKYIVLEISKEDGDFFQIVQDGRPDSYRYDKYEEAALAALVPKYKDAAIALLNS